MVDDSPVLEVLSDLGPRALIWSLIPALLLLFAAASAPAQGPPYYTNDPRTPGHLNWEINLADMPFLYRDQSVSTLLTSTSTSELANAVRVLVDLIWSHHEGGTSLPQPSLPLAALTRVTSPVPSQVRMLARFFGFDLL